jgi:HEAT repeat protein
MIVADSETDDPGARKMAAYVLGKLGDPRAVPRLTAMTGDHTADVRWNAAIALAELHDAGGKEVLHSMLDRASLSRQAPALRPAQAEEALVSAIMAEQILRDAGARPASKSPRATRVSGPRRHARAPRDDPGATLTGRGF